MPGRVEVWPFLGKPEKPDELPWDTPLDQLAPDDPVLVLADRIADEIAGWLDDPPRPPRHRTAPSAPAT